MQALVDVVSFAAKPGDGFATGHFEGDQLEQNFACGEAARVQRRQASSPSLCASVPAVPWADEAEQQLSRLAPSGCQLSADVCILRAGLQRRPAQTT